MEFNLRAIDLNLLPVFIAAYEERSLSRAAERLAMTPSATSHALARLRHLFKDELFIRHSRGMTPTPEADLIYPRVYAALAGVRELITDSVAFDPATSARQFAVALPHPLGPVIAIRLKQALALKAPGLRIEFNTASRPANLERSLMDGSVDLALDWLSPPEPQIRRETLFDDSLVLMSRAGHPLQAGQPTLKTLQKAGFVNLKPRATLDQAPESTHFLAGLQLRSELEVSELFDILLILQDSDLLGFMAGSLQPLAEAAFGLKPLQLAQLKALPIPVHALWHARRDKDLAHLYLRAELALVLREVLPERCR